MRIFISSIFILISSSVFSEEVLIDCGVQTSFRIKSEINQVSIKDKTTDYNWLEDFDLKIVTLNETDLVIGNENEWRSTKKNISYDRLLFKIPGFAGRVYTLYFYNSKDLKIETLEIIRSCSYRRSK